MIGENDIWKLNPIYYLGILISNKTNHLLDMCVRARTHPCVLFLYRVNFVREEYQIRR